MEDTMVEFLTADQNMFFAVILTIVGIFFVIELLGILIAGFDIAGIIDGIFPDIDIPDIEVDAGAVSKILGWLKYKEVPLILTLFILMGSLSIFGYTIQYVCYQSSSHLLSWWIPTLIALIPSLFITKISTNLIGKIITQEDKWVLNKEDLVGRCGVITTGTAKEGLAAEAKIIGPHGKHHYIRVIPQDINLTFPEKTHIITVRMEGDIYRVIKDKNPI
jgi:hypothetical protein